MNWIQQEFMYILESKRITHFWHVIAFGISYMPTFLARPELTL